MVAQDTNLATYERPDVVAFYDGLAELQPCEERVFSEYIPRGRRILDLGVGGGRTTPRLSSNASEYVGLDYARDMVARCRAKFPKQRFEVGDAADLSRFAEGSFDVIVFSLKGLDCLFPDSKRHQCLAECRRVLAPGGLFIFSSHNARVMFVRPMLRGTDLPRQLWRVARAGAKSVQLALRQLGTQSFWEGEGYVRDPVHGGLTMHVATEEKTIDETSRAGFTLVDVIGALHPAQSSWLSQPWYYYVFRRPGAETR